MNMDNEERDRRLLASALEKQRLILEQLASRENVSNSKSFGGGSDRPSSRPERTAEQITSVDTNDGSGSRDDDNSSDGSQCQSKGFAVGPAHVFQTPSPDDACDDDEKERRRRALAFEQQQLILNRVKEKRLNRRSDEKPGRWKPTVSKKNESSSPQIQYKNSKHVLTTTARVFQTPSPDDASDEEEQARRRHDLALEQQQLVIRQVEASRAKHHSKSCKPKGPGCIMILKPTRQPSAVGKTPHEGDSLQSHRTSSVKARRNEEESDRLRRTLGLEQQKVILTNEVEASRLSHQSKNKRGSRKVKHPVVGCLLHLCLDVFVGPIRELI
jgi:hypothetical protein